MNCLLLIILLLFANIVASQTVVCIHGKIVDERGKPVRHATLIYGDYKVDTVYSNNRGRFRLTYPNPQLDWFFLKIEKERFLPKVVLPNITSKDLNLEDPILLRSRKSFWYDSRKIDSTHLCITVQEAILKYRLHIDECLLLSEPPGNYYGFIAQLADSSYVLFKIQGYYKSTGVKMVDILDQEIVGFGIADINGNRRIIGRASIFPNQYFTDQQIRSRTQ